MTPIDSISIRLAAIRLTAFSVVVGSFFGTAWAGVMTSPVDLDCEPDAVLNLILDEAETPTQGIRTGNSLSYGCEALVGFHCWVSAISDVWQWISPKLVRRAALPHDATTLHPRLMEILKVPIESAIKCIAI